MADNEVIIEVTARLEKAEAALKKLEGQAKDSGEKTGKTLGDGLSKGAAIGFKALAVAAAAALAAVVVTFKKGIDAAIEQENAINDLNNALARTGQFSQAASQDMQDFASSLQRASIFGDEAILSNAALIQSLGKLSTNGLKQATQAAADLASALNIDLRTASQLVGKAAAGEVGSFSRYGLVIKQGATNAETFANALAKINAQFGGAAQAKVNTFGGAMTQLKNTFGDLLEEVGNLVIKSPTVVATFKFIGKAISGFIDNLKSFQKSSGDVFKPIILGAISLGEAFVNFILKPLEIVGNVIAIIAGKVRDKINELIAFLQPVIDKAVALATFFGEKVAEGFNYGLGLIPDSVSDTLNETFKGAFTTTGADSALGFLSGFRTAIETAPPLTETVKNGPVADIEEAFNDINFSGLVNSFRMTVTQMNDLAKSVTAQIRGTFVNGFSSAFASIGKTLVEGGGLFTAFGKAILGMFGDIAIQLGQFYLTLGLANLFLNPAAAAGQLAGGAALLILGGALKSLAGGGASSGAGGGAEAASAAAAPVGTSPANLQETDRQDPGTAVTVNVQGNILDRRETGLEIAQIINESFSTGGIVIARGAIG